MLFNEAQLDEIARFIETELGIVYNKDIYYQLDNRLKEIMKIQNLPDEKALWEKFQKKTFDHIFKQLLLDVATNNETYFFRDTKLFTMLQEDLFPKIIEKSKMFHIWTCASSFGQEVYSIQIILNRLREDKKLDFDYTFLASDVCNKALKRTTDGIYNHLEVQRGLDPLTMIKYFDAIENNEWKAKEIIRKNLAIRNINLLNIPIIGQRFDIVLCRNVLIYQSQESKIKILNKIASLMNPDAYLILGAAESNAGVKGVFQSEMIDNVLVFRKM